MQQELYKQIESIVLRFPFDIRDRYVSAAEDFRIPYWDWALGESGTDVPDFFVSPTIQVTGTDGLERAIPNPLHHYDLPRRIKEDFVGNVSSINLTHAYSTNIIIQSGRNGTPLFAGQHLILQTRCRRTRNLLLDIARFAVIIMIKSAVRLI